ncbi:MAG: N-methylhydantoinase A/oxoprolinase/acetone carboxylase beta subunit [Gammaproteobacteria bacterium]|jgi:N-methylhydantoinase A/oxoprolinase/acetone carboxylase beta subunit
MANFNIGIDTGGTYTDAVIIDAKSHEVIATAKALTTRGNLEIGVANALKAVIAESAQRLDSSQIALVSLSTTLATNALVEGMGSSVAAILIGFSDDMVKRSKLHEAIPSAKIIRIAGGHEYDGSETCALDEASLKEQILALNDSIEAFSVSANYSIRNSNHEQRAKQIIRQLTGSPVTASSELSDGLNGPLRALTATFNVRIVSLIFNLVESVRSAMQEQNIDAPLMIVKGDGSIASADSIVDKPIETILSGPAASVIGANYISGLNNFIISDVGGTTTDVAIVRNGWPTLNEKGAMAGGYRTLVRAIDMQTIGLGGDSEVDINFKGIVSLKANRVVPLSLVCTRFPQVISQLKTSLGEGMGLAAAIRFIFLAEGIDQKNLPSSLSSEDTELIYRIGDEPKLYDKMAARAADRSRLARLLARGIVQVSGLTPSDAAHALGLQSQWSTEAAGLACLMLGRSFGLISWKDDNLESEIQQFARRIFDTMVAKSSYLIINQLSGFDFTMDNPLVQAVINGENQLNDLSIQFTSSIPIVAVGGPAQVFYADVGKRLNSDCMVPNNAEVANAIGAAIGQIKIRTVIEITTTESGGYHLHHTDKPIFFSASNDALEQARTLASAYVTEKAKLMGGGSVEVDIQVKRVDLPNMDLDRSLIAATVVAECLSRAQI